MKNQSVFKRIATVCSRTKTVRIFQLIGIVLISFFFLFPVLWVLSVSVRSEKAVFETALMVKEWHFENYITAWKTFGFSSMFINSLFITVVSIAITVAFSALAGWLWSSI